MPFPVEYRALNGERGGYLLGLHHGVLEVIAHCASVQGETASRGTAYSTALWPQQSVRIRALAESALLARTLLDRDDVDPVTRVA